jgi:hypothetical protein
LWEGGKENYGANIATAADKIVAYAVLQPNMKEGNT